MKPLKTTLSLLLALSMLLAGCATRPAPVPEPEPEEIIEEEQVPAFINTLPLPTQAIVIPALETGYMAKSLEYHAQNSDTIGWLQIDGTTIDDVVMFYPHDKNDFYLRRGFNKEYDWYGTYFVDYRSNFDGKRQGMSRNTVIYGHSMDDNPNGLVFSQIKKYLDPDFARQHPYINFSTIDEDMVWEVFAVFYATTKLTYNRPDYTTDEAFMEMMEECTARSIYDYDDKVSAGDKILTLSTCCYNWTSVYPNNYRYVVMARQVKPSEKLKDEASFKLVENPRKP